MTSSNNKLAENTRKDQSKALEPLTDLHEATDKAIDMLFKEVKAMRKELAAAKLDSTLGKVSEQQKAQKKVSRDQLLFSWSQVKVADIA